MGYEVEGKVALVTGSNRGIGLEIAKALLNGGVAKLYAAARKPESVQPLVDEYGDRVVPIRIDVQDAESVAAAAATASDAQIVVNNAGVLKTVDPFADDTFESFQFELDVNVFGLLRVARAFAPVLKANGGGALVQLNSIASLKSFPAFTTYCASKAASYSITQALRDTLAEQGTAVLSVHPGPIATDMGDDAGFDEADSPTVVADGIVTALAAGDFHLFPDTMAQQVGAAYAGFAENLVEANLTEA
ncbi:(S)-1-Phenylethanol dehydrogenase [Planctomycetes bacterium MalM25]|nr:(S)-1-Phenylethanol dehydrogenase [Planctomycetes bacterium MalM25]